MLHLRLHMPLETLWRWQMVLRQPIVILGMLQDLLVDLLQQLHNSNAFRCGVFVAQAPRAVGADDELSRGSRRRREGEADYDTL